MMLFLQIAFLFSPALSTILNGNVVDVEKTRKYYQLIESAMDHLETCSYKFYSAWSAAMMIKPPSKETVELALSIAVKNNCDALFTYLDNELKGFAETGKERSRRTSLATTSLGSIPEYDVFNENSLSDDLEEEEKELRESIPEYGLSQDEPFEEKEQHEQGEPFEEKKQQEQEEQAETQQEAMEERRRKKFIRKLTGLFNY